MSNSYPVYSDAGTVKLELPLEVAMAKYMDGDILGGFFSNKIGQELYNSSLERLQQQLRDSHANIEDCLKRCIRARVDGLGVGSGWLDGTEEPNTGPEYLSLSSLPILVHLSLFKSEIRGI